MLGWTLLVVFLAGAIALGGFHRELGALLKSDSDKVFVTADWPSSCEADRPLRITVDNRSLRTIRSVEFRVEAYEPGNSADVMALFSRPEWTFVVSPLETKSVCFPAGFNRRINVPPGKLLTNVTGVFPIFYAAGAFVPK